MSSSLEFIIDDRPTELQVGFDMAATATFDPAPVYSGECVMGLSMLPFTTVEDDPHSGPAPILPEQLLV